MKTKKATFLGMICLLLIGCSAKPEKSKLKAVQDEQGNFLYWYAADTVGVDSVCHKLYYSNGILMKSFCSVKNKKYGVFSEYDSIGNKIKDVHYHNGIRSGRCIFYYPSGQINEISTFEDDKRHDSLFYYRENGELHTINIFKYGQLVYKHILPDSTEGPYIAHLAALRTNADTLSLGDTLRIRIESYFKRYSESEDSDYIILFGIQENDVAEEDVVFSQIEDPDSVESKSYIFFEEGRYTFHAMIATYDRDSSILPEYERVTKSVYLLK